jgi:endo-1,4-beta-xylanase
MDAPLLTLKDAAAASGILVGCAVDAARLRDSPDYATLVHSQANIIVAENAFKFEALRPTPHSFSFHDADTVADFAHTYGMKLRGHNFVWHRQLPTWFGTYVTTQNAEQVMVEHITTVGSRYAGGVHSWDVVNEAIELSDGRADGLRDSPWLKLMGPTYVDTAFQAARKADPKALLFYNEYGVEGEDDASAKKREAVLTMLRGMLERDVPLDGLGVQSHLTAGHAYGPGLRKMIRSAHQLGLRVMLTEMDVNDRELAATPSTRDVTVAETYSKYLRTAFADGYVSGVLTWGITDRWTWLSKEDSRSDGVAERPLPFDAALNPKAAFVAQRRALAHAPRVVPPLRRRSEALIELENMTTLRADNEPVL